MRLNDEGSYFPPSDVMNDIMKLMENIIAEIWMTDSFYYGIVMVIIFITKKVILMKWMDLKNHQIMTNL